MRCTSRLVRPRVELRRRKRRCDSQNLRIRNGHDIRCFAVARLPTQRPVFHKGVGNAGATGALAPAMLKPKVYFRPRNNMPSLSAESLPGEPKMQCIKTLGGRGFALDPNGEYT